MKNDVKQKRNNGNKNKIKAKLCLVAESRQSSYKM